MIGGEGARISQYDMRDTVTVWFAVSKTIQLMLQLS
jgi:hypothetical protein